MTPRRLNQITPRVFWLPPDSTTDRPVLGVVEGAHARLVVDAGNSQAHARLLLEEAERAGIAPPTFVALTHWHWDHVFGTCALPLPTFAHVETRRVVAEMAELDWSDEALDRRVEAGVEIAFCRDMIKAELPERAGLMIRPPDIAFTGEIALDLGGITCRIVHVGGDHAADSSVVYVPEEGIVFLGDCLYPDIYHPVRRFTTTKLFPLVDTLLGFDAQWYLAGHDPQPIPRAEIVEYTSLLKTIGRVVEEHAGDRAAVLANLPRTLGRSLDDDDLETVDEFLAGLDVAASAP